MEKKLTAQGPRGRKSYTVTLPIEWVKEEGLDKSRSVDLTVVGNKVIISAYKDPEKRILVKGDQCAKNFIKVLPGLYRRGVNEIKILFSDNKLLQEATDIVDQKLIGYEVIEQKKNYIIIKDITKESEEDFKGIFRRIFLLLFELAESDDVVQVKTFDKNIKKLINYCQRILMKKGHVEFQNTPLYYLILDRLEKLADEFRWLLRITISKKRQPDEMKEFKELLRVAYELFYKFDESKYNKYQVRTYTLRNEIKDDANIDKAVKVDKETIHMHNLARVLNSLYGDIFTLRFTGD